MDPDLLTDKEQIERNEQLARDIYPQPQGNSRFFTKAPQHEITLAIERSNEDAAFVVDWLKVWTIGLFAPIPLIIADIVFTAFLQKPSDDESMISAAIVGLPLFVFSLVLVLVLQKFIVPTLDSMIQIRVVSAWQYC
ncbi:MAG: hypothetical protein EOO17_04415 [Chloroflexi bacterium]|nr:MAG: hypothetical protein EOO17_04415 [Chloroflexota bacterium]